MGDHGDGEGFTAAVSGRAGGVLRAPWLLQAVIVRSRPAAAAVASFLTWSIVAALSVRVVRRG